MLTESYRTHRYTRSNSSYAMEVNLCSLFWKRNPGPWSWKLRHAAQNSYKRIRLMGFPIGKELSIGVRNRCKPLGVWISNVQYQKFLSRKLTSSCWPKTYLKKLDSCLFLSAKKINVKPAVGRQALALNGLLRHEIIIDLKTSLARVWQGIIWVNVITTLLRAHQLE